MSELAWRLAARTLSHPVMLRRLIKRGLAHPYTPIVKNNSHGLEDLYMDRLWLLRPYPEGREKHWLKTAGLMYDGPSARLHLINREDLDRDCHNHPWRFRTLCLRGGYIMEMLDGTRITVRPGDSYELKTNQYHRIVELLDGPTISIFITYEYEGVWGFMADGKHVPYHEYLNKE
jgi:hypothetical protein